MASIEVGPLSNNLDDDEIATLEEAFEDADIDLALDDDAEPRLLESDLDEDFFADFLDLLDANNCNCDIYVPGDFEDMVEVGGFRVGSAQTLLNVLDELRGDLFDGEIDDDEDGGDDDDTRFSHASDGPSVDLKADYMRFLWKALHEAANHSLSDDSGIYIRR